MTMTEATARAIAWDAGNASMRHAGRTAWNADDYSVAVREFGRLWPDEFRGQRFRLVNRESGSGDQLPLHLMSKGGAK